MVEYGHRHARSWAAAAHHSLYRADRVLRLLLHGGSVQSQGHGRQPEEVWWLPARHQAWRAHRRIYRLRADQDYGGRRDLSRRRVRPARDPHLLCRRAVLFWWHLAAHRGERHHGYRRPDSEPSLSPSI